MAMVVTAEDAVAEVSALVGAAGAAGAVETGDVEAGGVESGGVSADSGVESPPSSERANILARRKVSLSPATILKGDAATAVVSCSEGGLAMDLQWLAVGGYRNNATKCHEKCHKNERRAHSKVTQRVFIMYSFRSHAGRCPVFMRPSVNNIVRVRSSASSANFIRT